MHIDQTMTKRTNILYGFLSFHIISVGRKKLKTEYKAWNESLVKKYQGKNSQTSSNLNEYIFA